MKTRIRPTSASSAFTLAEMLVVVVVVGVLITLVLTGVKSMQESSESARCVHNLRQIGVGLAAYLGEHNGVYPLYSDDYDWDEAGNGVKVRNVKWNTPLITGGYVEDLETFICPSAHGVISPLSQVIGMGNISYGINIALSIDYPTTFPFKPARAFEVSAQTIVAGDAKYPGVNHNQNYGAYYMYGHLATGSSGQAWPRHNGGCNILWGDGHVTRVAATDPKDPSTLYDKDALGKLWDHPEHWLRTTSPAHPANR